ncbi:6655_t:CDS:1, partial [Scutellospora calospora]
LSVVIPNMLTEPLNMSSPIKAVKKSHHISSPPPITTLMPQKPIQQTFPETTHTSPIKEITTATVSYDNSSPTLPVKLFINDSLSDATPISPTRSFFVKDLPESSFEKKLPNLPKENIQSSTTFSSIALTSHRRKTIPVQSKRESMTIPPLKKNIPIYTTKNGNEGSQISPSKFDMPELDPLSKVQRSSDIEESTLKRTLSDPTSNTHVLPTLNITLSNDTDSWKLQDESLPTSSNRFKLDLDSSKLTENVNFNQQFEMRKSKNPFLYKVVGQKSGNKKKSLLSVQDSSTYVMEMQETHSTNDNTNSENSNKRELPVKSYSILRKPLPTYSSSSSKKSKLTNKSNKLPNSLTITLRNSGSFHTYTSSDDLKSVATGRTKRRTLKPVQIPKSPYSSIRPKRDTLSPNSTLKKNPFLKHIKTKVKGSGDHNLPEYTSSKSKMSFMVPHNLASVEYRKYNRSMPDLTARVRHNKFNKAFKRNNVTVPDFTRVNSVIKDSVRKKDVDIDMTFKQDADLNPSRVTKFSINLYDESESSELFKPGSPWIHLPHLDEYIKSLPQTEFSDPKDLMTLEEYEKFIKFSKPDKSGELMFPPMNQIPEEVSLEDLESNMLKKPSKFLGIEMIQGRRNDWLDAAVDGILAVEGYIGTQTSPDKMTIFEILRDFFQFLTLVLSFGSPGVFQSW